MRLCGAMPPRDTCTAARSAVVSFPRPDGLRTGGYAIRRAIQHAPNTGINPMARGRRYTRCQGSTTRGTTMTNELAAPNYDALYDFAARAVKSGLLPSAIKSPEAAFIIIATGAELGIRPMQALRGIHVIEGKAVLSADLWAALANAHKDCLYFMMVGGDDTYCTYETHRRGAPHPVVMTHTIEQARQAGKGKTGTWAAHPAAMLRARCVMSLARAVYPDLLLGVYEESEGEEIRESAQRPQRPALVTVEAEVLPALPPGSLSAGADRLEQETEARARAAIADAKSPQEVKAYMRALKTTDAALGDKLHEVGMARFWALSPPRHETPSNRVAKGEMTPAAFEAQVVRVEAAKALKAAPPAPPREPGEDDVNAEGPTPLTKPQF